MKLIKTVKLIETVGNLAVMCCGRPDIALSILDDRVILNYGDRKTLACHHTNVDILEEMKRIVRFD